MAVQADAVIVLFMIIVIVMKNIKILFDIFYLELFYIQNKR